jgi:hypothetical protein
VVPTALSIKQPAGDGREGGVAAAPSRLVGMPATRGIGCGGLSTPLPRTSGAAKNGAQ